MKFTTISTIVLAALLSAACSRSEEPITPLAPDRNLVVQAQLVRSSEWASARFGEPIVSGPQIESTDGEYLLTADKQEWTGAADTLAVDIPVTRGTPITSAAKIADMRVNIYNTGTSNWSTSSARTASIVATNESGSFTTSPSYNWVTDATSKTSLFAYSPAASSTNGLTDVAPNKINYSIPSDVTKQPDLCVATPQMNIINDDGNQQIRTFALSHQLTAVGFAMLGWKLKITSITVSNVATAGTLTMNSTGAPSWSTSATGSRNVGVTGSSYDHTINSSYADITKSDGYLMMIPHTLSSSAQVTIAYTSTGTGSTSGSITANLKDLGVTWNAGDKITYNIRLKTAPAVTSGDLAITTSKAGYSTSAPVSLLTDSNDKLTFTWNTTSAPWLQVYRGNPKADDIVGGSGSGWSTPPASNIYFFSKDENTSLIADRTVTVTVSGTRSGSKSFVVKQSKKVESNTPKDDQIQTIGNLIWAKGNLIASGNNGCKVGKQVDCGLYFRFGSLIGIGGGTNGDGLGIAYEPRSAAVRVIPAGYSGKPDWLGIQYYSSGPMGWDYGLPATDNAATGVGDPCRYYLGAPWRLPTSNEYQTLISGESRMGIVSLDDPNNPYVYVRGYWFGPGAGSAATSIFFSASGFYYSGSGSMNSGTFITDGYYMTSSRSNDSTGPKFEGMQFFTQSSTIRMLGTTLPEMSLSARCVRNK